MDHDTHFTNYLGHSVSSEFITKNSIPSATTISSKRTFLSIIILFLIFSNICSLSYIAILSVQPKAASSEQIPNQTVQTLQPQLGTDSVLTGTNIQYGEELPTYEPFPSTGIPKEMEEKIITQVQNLKTTNPNLYTATIGSANDTKRQSDLRTLSTALRVLSMEQENILSGVSNSPTCIGSQKPCFDLYSILIPNYMDKPLIDPHGNSGNTGYTIQSVTDGIHSFTLTATSEKGEAIVYTF